MVKTREITLLAWNLADGLSDPERAEQLAEKIADLDPGVAIFSEGAAEGYDVHPVAKRLLEEHVGNVYTVNYDDFDGRIDRHRLVAVARPEFGQPEVHSNLGRNGFYFQPPALPLRIAGLHAYDRNNSDVCWSDETRVHQVQDVISRLALRGDEQGIVLGDINSIYCQDYVAVMLRSLAPLFNQLPYKNPGEIQSGIERIGSISQRLAQIALGGPLRELADAGFRDGDSHHHATMQLGPVGAQLDHILARRADLHNFKIHSVDGLTDHKGISAKATVFLRRKDGMI